MGSNTMQIPSQILSLRNARQTVQTLPLISVKEGSVRQADRKITWQDHIPSQKLLIHSDNVSLLVKWESSRQTAKVSTRQGTSVLSNPLQNVHGTQQSITNSFIWSNIEGKVRQNSDKSPWQDQIPSEKNAAPEGIFSMGEKQFLEKN